MIVRGLATAALALALGACASLGVTTTTGTADRPPAPPPRTTFATPHRERAETFRREGDLRRALDEWKIALTIDPSDAVAREGAAKVQAEIDAGVATRLKQGREALARGAQLDARRHFLAVLALDPANKVAFDALRTEVRDVRFISHTVRAGDTLASLALRYYGDRSRSEVIWEVNQLSRNPRLTPGMVVRIPEIPGLPFAHERTTAPAAPATPTDSARTAATPPPAPEAAPPPEVDPRLAEARDAMDKGEYTMALADIEQVLAANPRNTEGTDLKKAALYGLGKAQLNERKFDESYQTLTQLTRLAPNYEDSPALLQQARTRLVQQRYSEGLRYYREEKLEEAIAEWRAVLVLDPRHPSARKNIEQAERILKQLEERRQK
ncbi:MAG TPA: LysM peptidoglycan-binding domain-containing protein [Methylomirabilota bacterium]|jgi:tetratricopeptide (TPR) repeat protein